MKGWLAACWQWFWCSPIAGKYAQAWFPAVAMQQLVPERLIPDYLGYHFTTDIAGQIWFGALCLSSFLLQIQFTCLNRVTLLVNGIYNERKGGNLQLMHTAQPSKDGVWQHHGYMLPRHSYMLHTKQTIPLLLYNSPPSDFVTSKLVQKILQQFYNFLLPQYWAQTIWFSDIHKCIALSPDNDSFTSV